MPKPFPSSLNLPKANPFCLGGQIDHIEVMDAVVLTMIRVCFTAELSD